MMETIILDGVFKFYPYKQLDNNAMSENENKFMDGLLTGVSLGISIMSIIISVLGFILKSIGKS